MASNCLLHFFIPVVANDKIFGVMTFSFILYLFSFLDVKRYGLWPGKILVHVYEATDATIFCSQNTLQFCFQVAGIQDGAVHT